MGIKPDMVPFFVDRGMGVMSVIEFRHLICHVSRSCLGFGLHQHHSFGKIICSLHHGQTDGFRSNTQMLTGVELKGCLVGRRMDMIVNAELG